MSLGPDIWGRSFSDLGLFLRSATPREQPIPALVDLVARLPPTPDGRVRDGPHILCCLERARPISDKGGDNV
jgi:hypothetical protein